MLMVEGFVTFGRSWREWLKLALIFCAIWLCVSLAGLAVFGEAFHTMTNMDLTNPKHKMTPDEAKAVLALVNIPALIVFGLLVLVISTAQYYLMLMLFSDKDRLFGQPAVPKISGYFYTCWKTFLAALISVAPLMGTMVLAVVGIGLKSGWIVGLSFLPGIVGVVYLSIKYTLVFPLAANGLQSPIKASWHMTKGNWWPLFGNGLLLLILLYSGCNAINIISALIVGLPAGIVMGLAKTDPIEGSKAIICLMVALGCINNVVWTGIVTAYRVACVRVLDKETSE